MKSRLDLHKLLCDTLGSSNVYFQPPDTLKMSYPAIVYELDDISSNSADNIKYIKNKRYSLTFMTKDPDSKTIDDLSNLPMCSFDREFKSSNLNQYVYSIYY